MTVLLEYLLTALLEYLDHNILFGGGEGRRSTKRTHGDFLFAYKSVATHWPAGGCLYLQIYNP